MSITARMKVAELLEQHPDAEEVFDSYGIELDEHSMQLTLDALCREEAINYWELKSDIALSEGWDGAAPGFGDDDDDDDDEEEDWDEEEDEEEEEDVEDFDDDEEWDDDDLDVDDDDADPVDDDDGDDSDWDG